MPPELRTRREFLVRLAFELVIVFVGVYAAFALQEWEARREAAERRAQIQQALVQEIRDIIGNTRIASEWTSRLVAEYDSAFAKGETPALVPLIEPVRVHTHMWEATIESGGLDLLDVPTIYRISEFYNGLNAGFEQLSQLRTLSESMLIPNLGNGTSAFYDSAGRLRPEYHWYIGGMRNLSVLADRITEQGELLVRDLGGEAADTAPTRQ
ncbi:MAG TPA: hypothetical protein VIL18_08280 [Longimicrobiales bacterium]